MNKKLSILAIVMIFVLVISNVPSVKVKAESSTGVIIDGYYDDWEDKPISILTWNSNNGNAYHDVSMIKDDDYIYIFLGMHPSYHSSIPIHAINLSINNQNCQLFLGYANSQNSTDWGRPVDVQKKGIYLGLHPFTSYPNYSLGDAAIAVYNGSDRDKLEIRVRIESLESVLGLTKGTVNHGSTIRLNMPNVGAQTIELVGTSSGPIVGILISVGMVAMILWWKHRKMGIIK